MQIASDQLPSGVPGPTWVSPWDADLFEYLHRPVLPDKRQVIRGPEQHRASKTHRVDTDGPKALRPARLGKEEAPPLGFRPRTQNTGSRRPTAAERPSGGAASAQHCKRPGAAVPASASPPSPSAAAVENTGLFPAGAYCSVAASPRAAGPAPCVESRRKAALRYRGPTSGSLYMGQASTRSTISSRRRSRAAGPCPLSRRPGGRAAP